MTYYSSDDAVKWAEFMAEYGIFRTEWENVIEVLNKDEGGLNQYFDEAKTSDKLIAKFFIPAIEQKLMNAASKGTDCSLETMLINYARKITDKESVIKQHDAWYSDQHPGKCKALARRSAGFLVLTSCNRSRRRGNKQRMAGSGFR